MNTPQRSNRFVIITGGGSGIGKALAKKFTEQGDQVAIIGRNIEKLKMTSKEIGTTWFQANVGVRSEINNAILNLTQQDKKIDVLINCAGIAKSITIKTPIEKAEADWDELINTNLKGCFLTCMAALPYLRNGTSSIINFSSIAALSGGRKPGQIGYAASKSGLHGLTYALAKELAPQGIRVNLIAPGFVTGTDLFGGESLDRTKEVAATTPLSRAANTNDIFNAARFLASEDSSFVTGEILNVNGGLLFAR